MKAKAQTLKQLLTSLQNILGSDPKSCGDLLQSLGLSISSLESQTNQVGTLLGLNTLERDLLLLISANQLSGDAILPGPTSIEELSIHLSQKQDSAQGLNRITLGSSPLISDHILDTQHESKLRVHPEIQTLLAGADQEIPYLSGAFELWTRPAKPYAIWDHVYATTLEKLLEIRSVILNCYSNDPYQDLLEVGRITRDHHKPFFTLDLAAFGTDFSNSESETTLKRIRNTILIRNGVLGILHSDQAPPSSIRMLFHIFHDIGVILFQTKPRQDLRSSFGPNTFDLFTAQRGGYFWAPEIKSRKIKISPDDAVRLESLFSLNLTQIDRVLNELELSHSDQAYETIAAACRKQGSQVLEQFAKRIEPKYSWDNLILPPKTKLKLAEIYQHVAHRSQMESQWSNRQRHNRGHGTTIVFEGDSGTGKTMAAEVLARSLGLNLFQVDLSKLTSKYIGDTEKHLSLIFSAARESSGILLFDEGESLFSKRSSEASSSQDRYSNLEINHLLQELESFDGIVVISTNLAQNIDEAFLRRISFQVSFPKPDESTREQIWRGHLSGGLPIHEDVDFKFLSTLSVSGGLIRNIARMAASWASIRGDSLTMRDILWSIRREFAKAGLSIEREAFGEIYWKHVSPDWESVHASKRHEELRPPAP